MITSSRFASSRSDWVIPHRLRNLMMGALVVLLPMSLTACASTSRSTIASTVAPKNCSGKTGMTNGGSPPPTEQLSCYLTTSLDLPAVPDLSSSIPSLSSSAADGLKNINSACYSEAADPPIPADASSLCAAGNVSSARTVFLFGDSQAAMWQPAFDAIGKDLAFKVIFLGKPGCSPWVHPTGIGDPGCNDFVQREIQFANQIHPVLSIPIGMSIGWGNNKFPTQAQLVGEMQKTFNLLEQGDGKSATISIIPQFDPGVTTTTPQICLTTHASDAAPCESLLWTDYHSNPRNLALASATRSTGAHEIQSDQFFCSGRKCATFVQASDGVHLVYQDGQHMNISYSAWVSKALESEIAPLL